MDDYGGQKTAHILQELVSREMHALEQRLVRAFTRQGLGSGSTGGGGGIGKTGAVTVQNDGFQQSAVPQDTGSPYGQRYDLWPLREFQFTSSTERLINLDEFVGVAFVEAMRGSEEEGGHRHTGENGEGPRLQAAQILAPANSGFASLEAYLAAIPGAGGAGVHAPGQPVLWDDFEVEDQTTRWIVRYGAPARVNESGGNARWELPTGTVFRARGSGFSYNDRLAVRCDLLWAIGVTERTFEVKLRSRATAFGYTYVVGVSSSRHCYLAELDNVSGVMEELAVLPQLPNDGMAHTLEIVIADHLLLLSVPGVGQMQVLLARHDGDVEGYLDFYNPGGTVRLDNLLVARLGSSAVSAHGPSHHANGVDPLDVADLADRLGVMTGGAGGTLTPHALTHGVGGTDPLDVASLPDSTGTRLTPIQKSQLTSGGVADAQHVHAGMLALDHVTPGMPLGRRGDAGLPGTDRAAPADHRHAQPYWQLEYMVSGLIGIDFPVDDGHFEPALAPVRMSYVPSIGGEFRFSMPGQGLAFRATMSIRNDGPDRSVQLFLPLRVGNVRLKLFNPTDGDLLLLWSAAGDRRRFNTRWNMEVATVLRGGETNRLRVYGSIYTGSTPGNWWVTNLEANGDLLDPVKQLHFVEP